MPYTAGAADATRILVLLRTWTERTDTGRPEEEAPMVPVGHKCGESARRIRLTVHGLPADRVWYLVLVQAYLAGRRGKGHGDERLEGQDGQ